MIEEESHQTRAQIFYLDEKMRNKDEPLGSSRVVEGVAKEHGYKDYTRINEFFGPVLDGGSILQVRPEYEATVMEALRQYRIRSKNLGVWVLFDSATKEEEWTLKNTRKN